MNGLEIQRTPELVGAEIRSLTTQAKCLTLWYGIEIGRKLSEAKELVEHGEWLTFLKEETEFSQPTASRFMKLYNEYGADQKSLFGAESKYSTLNNLSVTNALTLLAIPESERESFAADTDAEHISARELEKLVKERTAELEARIKAAETDAEGSALAIGERDTTIHTLKEQLATARERIREQATAPVPVAVERDEQAIKDAVEDALADQAKELETIKIELDKAKIELDVANKNGLKKIKELEKAKEDTEKIREELAAAYVKAETVEENGKAEAEAEIKRLEKALALADPEVVTFKAAFERVQLEFQRMAESLSVIKDSEIGAKLRAAARALVDKFGAELGG